MSVSAPPPGPPVPPAAPQQAQQRPPAQGSATHSFPDLHSLAADVQADLGALATGLAHAGAAAPVVQRISQMAGTLSEVTHILSQSPPIPNPAHAPAQAQPMHQPQAPQQPQQQGASAGGHKALASAVSALAQHAAANAQQQGQ